MKRTTPESGFTLIELVIVVTVLGLVMALAYPQYQALSHSNLRNCSRQLAGSIRYAYARSILEKKPWRLAIDFKANKYWAERLETETDETMAVTSPADDSWVSAEAPSETDHYSLTPNEQVDSSEPATWTKVTSGSLKEKKLPKGVIFRDVRVVGRDEANSGIYYIYFNPFGGVERAVMHIKHEDHEWVYTIVTKPLTGRVAIFDTDKDIERAPMAGPVRE